MATGLGVIGLGSWGALQVARLRSCPSAELAAVCDADAGRAKQTAQEEAVPKWYDDFVALLKDPAVQAVYICTPVHCHVSQATAAARAGKHIMCEKPLAMNVDEGQRIVDACCENSITLACNYALQFHGGQQKIKQLVNEGTIGRPVFGRARFSFVYPPDKQAWRQDPSLGGGGPMMDVGIHCVNFLRGIFGEVEEVTCRSSNALYGYPVEDTAGITLRFVGGAMGFVDCEFTTPHYANLVEVHGTEGSLTGLRTFTRAPDGEVLLFVGEGPPKQIQYEPVDQFKVIFETFLQAVAERPGQPVPLVGGEDALEDLRIIRAAYESADSGKSVRLLRTNTWNQ